MWAVPSTAPGNQSFSLSGMRIRGERALSTIEDMSDADKSDDRLGKRRSSDDRSRMDKISEMNEPTAVSAHTIVELGRKTSDFDTPQLPSIIFQIASKS
ncbi:hypothetical protein JR316_0005288 [Psilocybe cubensis]|uniref:Uncharacterized protein n=1 Tax=Psilocybe cubensis TaxID=181762 RepID=A0ACB8H7M9_PSICU|nr:hypothetical protein JR316_0005288 [Psilocybe cubensis]KAH9483184.1 hypothetical protein JR316_0005288 [Psilocybe cubensis]